MSEARINPDQQRALEKLSIVLARENGAMIARATSWQQAVATRP